MYYTRSRVCVKCQALADCARIDECKDWADKAAALASYARQANDATLQKHALRIQARAIRRCGELLKQIPDTNRGRPSKEIRGGTVPNIEKPDDAADLRFAHAMGSISAGEYAHRLTRTEAADAAGLSERQRKTALRVASVPAEHFEAAVEADTPPTVTTLAVIQCQLVRRRGRAGQYQGHG